VPTRKKRLPSPDRVARLERALARARAARERAQQALGAAREREAASTEILKVIAESASDVQPVFDAIARSAVRLVGGHSCCVTRIRGDQLQLVALTSTDPTADALVRSLYPMSLAQRRPVLQVVRTARPLLVRDIERDPRYSATLKQVAGARGFRTIAFVPMLRNGAVVGVVHVASARARSITDEHVRLLEAFAHQAVIAIETARLFTETKEALERQTATAEILKIISESPTDVQPVFEAIVRAGVQLFEGAGIALARPIGNEVCLAATAEAHAGSAARMWQRFPIPLDRAYMHSAAILNGRMIDVPDATVMDGHFDVGKQNFLATGNRAITIVPMMREGAATGTISVVREKPGALSDEQIALLHTFADQAVIAIENVRLFKELETRNRDLVEALERQTATAEILRVISSSPTDLQPVFEAIVRSASRLCGGEHAIVTRYDNQLLHLAAQDNPRPGAAAETAGLFPQPPRRDGSVSARALFERRIVHVPDVDAEALDRSVLEAYRRISLRAAVAVPLIHEGRAAGVLSVSRGTPGPFSDRQIALLSTFADQAVIAIENVRLFKELATRNRDLVEALDRQTATAEILRVISQSRTDAQPVFEAIAASARALCRASFGSVFTYDGSLIHVAAVDNFSPEAADALRHGFPVPPSRGSAAARAVLTRTVVTIPDVLEDPDYALTMGAKLTGYRSTLSVPMLRGGSPIGAISVARDTPGAFAHGQVELLQTFADQAVIAIENARLLKELEARTGELTRSVDQLIALGEVGRAVTSSLDLDTVLATIVSRAVQLTGLEAGAIYEYDEGTETFDLRATERLGEDEVHILRTVPLRRGEGAVGQTAVTLEPIQIPDITDTRLYQSRLRDLLMRSGHRALLAVPLLREDQLIGALVVNRKTPGPFPPEVVELLRTFATQSALAIQNARLFREIEDKSRQLEQASRHKSQFLASMSHELRTPLNAILGLNEMLLGEVYGEVPEDMKPPLVQTQASGRHLLGLINNVLDLAKIEANRLDLALGPYVVQDLLASVRATLAPLAAEKGLAFTACAPDDLPVPHGDAGRLTQCLINLAGNALKFTKKGRVDIRVEPVEDRLRFSVADTGIGIAPDKIADLFTEFKQTDATIAREYGGTGLGLAITRKFIELHKGSIWVESELGRGSTFIFEIPLQVQA